MAETTIVATVARVEGRAFARSTDGKLRALQEGDALREGEVVVTESGARVELVATGGGRIDLPAGGEVRITADLDEATRADAAAARSGVRRPAVRPLRSSGAIRRGRAA